MQNNFERMTNKKLSDSVQNELSVDRNAKRRNTQKRTAARLNKNLTKAL